jgi:hypothetical protein
MSFKDGLGQIVKLFPTVLTLIPLPLSLPIVKAAFVDYVALTMGTAYSLRPAHLSNLFIAFGIV